LVSTAILATTAFRLRDQDGLTLALRLLVGAVRPFESDMQDSYRYDHIIDLDRLCQARRYAARFLKGGDGLFRNCHTCGLVLIPSRGAPFQAAVSFSAPF
jgi:hypothetical protein